MRIDVVTIFPGMFREVLDFGIVRRAREARLVEVQVHDLRSWTTDRHRTTDDAPYGGGPGMVMKVEPLVSAVEAIAGMGEGAAPKLVLLSPRGTPLDQPKIQELSEEEHLVLVAGRYEGVDERFVELTGAEEISIGDYVLSGGEIPAMVVIDAVVRLLPGAISDPQSAEEDSFSRGVPWLASARCAAFRRPRRGSRVAGEPRSRRHPRSPSGAAAGAAVERYRVSTKSHQLEQPK